MVQITPFEPHHLRQLQQLLNVHLGALVPGWALPQAFILARLERNPDEPLVDPWVAERRTLCAVDAQQLVAAAHLLRYGVDPQVGAAYRNVGEINWLVALPQAFDPTAALLAAAQEQMRAWGVDSTWADVGGLLGPFVGVPDAWPHLAAALRAAGFHPEPGVAEAVYGGTLDAVGPVGAPPIAGLQVVRSVGRFGARFTAWLDGQAVGAAECISDLSQGGALPALQGWGELAELEVAAPLRKRGVGAYLVRHAVAWLRLGRCERIVLAVAPESEAAGVDRFYGRFGWTPLVRATKGWRDLGTVSAPDGRAARST
jgi:GNAT superfamily N-acetyltransferase